MQKNKSRGRVSVGHPVDVATGALFHEFEDYILTGRIPLVFGRRYSTAMIDRDYGMFGPGWSSPFEMRIRRDLDGYVMTDEDGETLIEFDDLSGIVESGGTVSDFGAFCELCKKDRNLIVKKWNPDTYDVVKYIFSPNPRGKSWRLTAKEDCRGAGFDINHDENGRVWRVILRREKRGYELSYDPDGRVREVFFTTKENTPGVKKHSLIKYEYDKNGLLSGFKDALGNTCSYEYDSSSRMAKEANIGRMTYVFRYDAKGRCIETGGIDGFGKNTLAINDRARMTEVTDSLGNTTLYEWNEAGQIIRTISPLGHISLNEYDEYGRLISETDPAGNTTSYEYDENGNRIKIISPSGKTVLLSYDKNHMITGITDPAGGLWQRQYDKSGRVRAVINPLNEKISYEYGSNGDLTAIIDNKGNRQRLEWDRSGNLTAVGDPLGNYVRYFYDRQGRLTAMKDELGNLTKARLDPLGRVAEIHLPDGATRKFKWDPYDQLVFYQNEKNNITRWKYKACGLLSKIRKPGGGIISFNWATEPGQLISVTNELKQNYRFEYDEDGRLVKETDFAGQSSSYEYSSDGLIKAAIDANGQRTEIKRDDDGNIVEIIYGDKSFVKYEYDQRGFLIKADNGACPVEREYDAAGRILSEKQGRFEIKNKYDSLGFRTKRSTSLGHETRFSWNANGKITRIAQKGFNPIQFEYDAASNETARFTPNGVKISRAFNKRMQMVNQEVSRIYGGVAWHLPIDYHPVIKREYQYDPAGNLTDIADKRWGKINFRYDESDRITGSRFSHGFEERFKYDVADNLAGKSKTVFSDDELSKGPVWEVADYAPGNRLTKLGNKKYEYDNLGRLVKKHDENGITVYVWDFAGQLTKVILPDKSEWEYKYDPFGRRVEKKGPGKTIRFVWDQDVVLHEIRVKDGDKSGSDTKNSRIITWEFAPGGFEPICKISREKQYLCVNDVAGNPRELMEDDGSVAWDALYETNGKIHASHVARVDCPVRFQGQWYDEETGLHYNRFRYYNPETGRFISPDPLGLSGGINQFVYAPNPTGWIDPYGLTKKCWKSSVDENSPPNHPGFEPHKKKKGKEKIPWNKNRKGFPDKFGNYWEPISDGHKGTHAPHWDVQHPNGTHTSVYPVEQ